MTKVAVIDLYFAKIKPKEIEDIYNGLPTDKLKGIQQRDKK